MARKERLFSRIPAYPMREVNMPMTAAIVEMTSSGWFPTLIMSAWGQTLNQVRRQKTRAVKEYTICWGNKYVSENHNGRDCTYQRIHNKQNPLEHIPFHRFS
jgi:hypothetical protein